MAFGIRQVKLMLRAASGGLRTSKVAGQTTIRMSRGLGGAASAETVRGSRLRHGARMAGHKAKTVRDFVGQLFLGPTAVSFQHIARKVAAGEGIPRRRKVGAALGSVAGASMGAIDYGHERERQGKPVGVGNRIHGGLGGAILGAFVGAQAGAIAPALVKVGRRAGTRIKNRNLSNLPGTLAVASGATSGGITSYSVKEDKRRSEAGPFSIGRRGIHAVQGATTGALLGAFASGHLNIGARKGVVAMDRAKKAASAALSSRFRQAAQSFYRVTKKGPSSRSKALVVYTGGNR